jgi:excisionase family DNA binding protein
MSDEFAFTIPSKVVHCFAELVANELAERIAPPPAPYLDADQAAEHLACSRRRIYDLAERKALPFYRDGKRLLFRRADLDSYVSTPRAEGRQ